jgi:hypothetical protein
MFEAVKVSMSLGLYVDLILLIIGRLGPPWQFWINRTQQLGSLVISRHETRRMDRKSHHALFRWLNLRMQAATRVVGVIVVWIMFFKSMLRRDFPWELMVVDIIIALFGRWVPGLEYWKSQFFQVNKALCLDSKQMGKNFWIFDLVIWNIYDGSSSYLIRTFNMRNGMHVWQI